MHMAYPNFIDENPQRFFSHEFNCNKHANANSIHMVQNIHLPDCFIKEKKFTKLDNNCQLLAKIDEMVLS
jgi:hypothetical protein